jgi:hypothetical protein
MLIAGHMQKIIQIYPCLLKLSRKQDTILKIGDFSLELSLSWMGSYMEIFEARVFGENLSFWLKNHQY